MAQRNPSARACPCGSKLALRECCQILHDGAEPSDPAGLVRARFTAFALGRADFLFRTLHPEHELRSQDETTVVRGLRQAHETLRYRSLHLHETRIDGDRAWVLYTVRVFRAGRDRSFVELAEMGRASGAWRYLRGEVRDASSLPHPTFSDFDA